MRHYLLYTILLVTTVAVSASSIDRSWNKVLPVNISEVQEATPEIEAAIFAQQAPRRMTSPATKASDLVGGYNCAYNWCEDICETTDGIPTLVSGNKLVRIYDANDSQKSIKIAGLFDAPVSATIDFTNYDVPLITVENNPIATYNQYEGGGYYTRGVGYYAAENRFYFTRIRAWVYNNEIELVDNIWIVNVKTLTGGTNTLWGYVWKPGSLMTPNDQVNGVMTYHFDDFNFGAGVTISENSNYVVSVGNFADVSVNPVTIKLKRDKTWVAEMVTLYTTDNGAYVLHGTNDDKEFFQLTGTGTTTSLTAATDWTAVVSSGEYWFGQCEPFTIRLFGGQFVYPGQSAPILGDLNDDGEVDVTDVNILINIILGQLSQCDGEPDLNGDGSIDVADVNIMVNIMLGQV